MLKNELLNIAEMTRLLLNSIAKNARSIYIYLQDDKAKKEKQVVKMDAKDQEVFIDKVILDMDALKVAFMDDISIIKQILQAFQDTFKHFQTEFDALHQAGMMQELSRLVHGLKGSSANIRANVLASQAAVLQQQIDQKQDYQEIYRALLMTLSRLDQEIESLKAT